MLEDAELGLLQLDIKPGGGQGPELIHGSGRQVESSAAAQMLRWAMVTRQQVEGQGPGINKVGGRKIES